MNRILHKIRTGVLIAIILGSVVYLMLAFYVASYVNGDTAQPSDAIIVLGARSYLKGEYNPCLVARVKHGVTMYRSGFADTIIMSGGKDYEDGAIEAEVMKEIAISYGASIEDILLEPNSTSTYENLRYSKQLMQENQINSILIVTAPYHMARASLVATKLRIPHTVSPAADIPCWAQWKYFSRSFLIEPIAIAVYFIQDKL